MVKAEEDGLGHVNQQRGTRPMRQKRRLGKFRAKGSWYKHPGGCSDNSRITPTVVSKGKSVPASQFTRKAAAELRILSPNSFRVIPGLRRGAREWRNSPIPPANRGEGWICREARSYSLIHQCNKQTQVKL